MAGEAVGGGADLVQFMAAVLRGDAKTLGVRSVPLRDRMAAAAWLGDRAFGKPTLVVDIPDEVPQVQVALRDQIRAWAQRLPPDLREALGEHMDEEFERQIEEDIRKVDEVARSLLPPAIVLDRPRDGQR